MGNVFQSSRDVILRTSQWVLSREFYEKVLGFKVTNETDAMLRVETGAIRLFVEKGPPHGPVFDFLVRDVQDARKSCWPPAACSSRRIRRFPAAICEIPSV
jgi:catechol 2,3-dioxygenase-like lactoylglutathione lyase family enzyme